MAKRAAQTSQAAAKSPAPAPAKPTKAPPIIPAVPGKGSVGGSDPGERAKRVPTDEFISRYLESQVDSEMTWSKFAEKWGMNKGTCQVALQNAKNMLKKHGLSDEQIEEALPPFQSRDGGSRESTGKALQMLLSRVSGWNAGSK